MNDAGQSWYARMFVWWLRRNPLYLMSAACMAVGARLYLVNPGSYAGDVGLILLTLGVLQTYEWAVMSILLVLHRSRRSPEDEPSLLLVAALFWTGPMAATVELSARQAHDGLVCAVGVLVFGLLELAVVRRQLTLYISLPGRLSAAACLALLVAAPYGLHVDTAAGTNELLLYFCWWLLAAAALLVLGSTRAHAAQQARGTFLFPDEFLGREMAFVALVVAATATHLVGMNYAFVGHARSFYAAPLLLVVAAVMATLPARGRVWAIVLRSAVVATPLVALGLALQRFDSAVPVRDIPVWLRDPLLTTLVASTVLWWFSARRLRSLALCHLGSLALLASVLRGAHVLPAPTFAPVLEGASFSHRDLLSLALFALTAYLLVVAWIHRARLEGLLGLFVLQLAVATSVYDRTPGAPLAVSLVACWSLLVALHLGERRPAYVAVVGPIAILLAVSWCYDFHVTLCWLARANAAAIIVVLLGVGSIWRTLHYRRMAVGVVLASVVFYAGRVLASVAHPIAALVVGGSFTLLVAGATVSWHKRRLMQLVQPPAVVAPATNKA